MAGWRHDCLASVNQMNTLQSIAQRLVVMLVMRIKIVSNCAWEDHRILENDLESTSKLMKLDFRDVQLVNDDRAWDGFQDTKECKC